MERQDAALSSQASWWEAATAPSLRWIKALPAASHIVVMFIVMAAVNVIPFWMIFQKAGHSKWLSLLVVIPLVNVIPL